MIQNIKTGYRLLVTGYCIKIILLTTGLGFTFQSYAQTYSLDSVFSVIHRSNPMLQEYDSKVKAMNAYTEGARSWMAPMVGIGTFMTPYPGQKVMEQRDKGFWMFSAEQNIPNPARLNATKNYLASRAKVEEQGKNYQFNTLRSEAKSTYYQWLVLEKKMNILKENEQIVELMLKLARIRYPYNQSSLGNIYKTEGRLHEVQNMMLMTQSAIDEKNYRLKALMNINPEAAIKIDTSVQVRYDANRFIYDTASIGDQRSDIKQIDQTIQVMRLNQQLQNIQAKPDFKIRYDHMGPLGSGMPQQFTLMGMISIPIAPWSSRMYKSEVKGMSYEVEAMKKNREAILVEARGMLAGMAAQLNSMQKQLDNYHSKIIPALRKNYETLLLAYEENREQLLVVLDGWEAMNMAQMEYLNKMEEYYLMIVKYEREIEK
jgi:cobalt-zinc-cadmium efflux system outer membrane protein